MKIYNRRISRSIGISTASVLAVVFYLTLNIVLNLSQNVIDPTGENYSEVFGIIQMLIMTCYWILLNYFYFSRPGKTSISTIIIYFLFMMVPIMCFTIATIVLITYYPITDFVESWNILTWVVAPTLFWYLPYSILYYLFGNTVSISIFIGISLVYNIAIIIIGIVLGCMKRSYDVEKEAASRRSRAQSAAEVIIDIPSEAELVSNYSEEEIDLTDIPTDILQMDETEIINQEIDKIEEVAEEEEK